MDHIILFLIIGHNSKNEWYDHQLLVTAICHNISYEWLYDFDLKVSQLIDL